MSTKYKEAAAVPTSILAERLKQLSDAIIHRDMGELTMRIPAELDRDADLVLTEASRRLLEFEEINK